MKQKKRDKINPKKPISAHTNRLTHSVGRSFFSNQSHHPPSFSGLPSQTHTDLATTPTLPLICLPPKTNPKTTVNSALQRGIPISFPHYISSSTFNTEAFPSTVSSSPSYHQRQPPPSTTTAANLLPHSPNIIYFPSQSFPSLTQTTHSLHHQPYQRLLHPAPARLNRSLVAGDPLVLPPPETETIGKAKEKNRSAEREADPKQRRRERKNKIENKEKKLKPTACGVFCCFAGHRQCREIEKRKTFPIHWFYCKWRRHVEQHAATVPALFLRFQKASQHCYGFFRGSIL